MWAAKLDMTVAISVLRDGLHIYLGSEAIEPGVALMRGESEWVVASSMSSVHSDAYSP